MMFRRLNLVSKIGGGFGVVILLLIIVSMVSWHGLSGVVDGFTSYRKLARNSNLVGNFQNDLLMMRINVKDYLLDADENDLETYHTYRDKIDDVLETAHKSIQDPDRAKVIDEMSADIVAYDKAFNEMADLIKKRHQLVNEVLNTLGPEIEKGLTTILRAAEENSDSEAVYEASLAMQHMLLGQLYTVKFLDINSKENEARAMAELGKLHKFLNNLGDTVLPDIKKKALQQAEQYETTFKEVVATIYARNEINADLDSRGPEMVDNVGTLKDSYQEDQETLGPLVQTESKNSILTIIVVSAIAILLGAAAAFLITRSLTGPIRRIVDYVNVLAGGDFTGKLETDSQDEIGKMSRTLSATVQQLGEMIKEIINGVNTLSSSSTELSAVSEQLAGNAENTSSRSNAVASAAEEMSANMDSVSAAMEQSSSNVGMVATATEEMASTVNEIAENAAKAKDVSEEAVQQSEQTSQKINDLGQAATRIGKVTEAITEISEQTNLLALNATIEAARAGEAGKGFAVVANEIKELAKQTAEATVDIKNQIDEMQNTTNSTITDIEKIGQVIGEINNVINTIATAVEQQSAATSEISRNIAQASAGISEVNENVAQSSVASSEITKEINSISSGSEEISQGSQNVKTSAAELSNLAEQLNELVGRFQVA